MHMKEKVSFQKTHVIALDGWSSDGNIIINNNTGKIAFETGEPIQLISTRDDLRCLSGIRAVFRRPNGQISTGCFSWLIPINT